MCAGTMDVKNSANHTKSKMVCLERLVQKHKKSGMVHKNSENYCKM